MKLLRYHESRQRGSVDFPLEYHDLDERHPRYQMPYHWHEEYEMLRIRTGEFDLTLDGETVTLQAGDVAFIAAEQLHGGVPRACTYDCIVFDLRMLLKGSDLCKRQISDILHRRVAVRSCFRAQEEICRVLSPMFDALHEGCAGSELITLGCLMQFLGEVCRQGAYQPAEPSGRKVLQLKRVFEIIESDYAGPLTLDALASAVHMTPKYFCRFFKQATHRTPIDYLNYYRIEAACYELAATEKNVTEVALDTGFTNVNYFIRQFRHYKGVTPGRYLAMMRQMQ